MSFQPEVRILGGGDKWSTNHLLFATEEEARLYVRDLERRWLAVADTRTVEIDKPPTHVFERNQLSRIKDDK